MTASDSLIDMWQRAASDSLTDMWQPQTTSNSLIDMWQPWQQVTAWQTYWPVSTTCCTFLSTDLCVGYAVPYLYFYVLVPQIDWWAILRHVSCKIYWRVNADRNVEFLRTILCAAQSEVMPKFDRASSIGFGVYRVNFCRSIDLMHHSGSGGSTVSVTGKGPSPVMSHTQDGDKL